MAATTVDVSEVDPSKPGVAKIAADKAVTGHPVRNIEPESPGLVGLEAWGGGRSALPSSD
jgi:hypothetical protein